MIEALETLSKSLEIAVSDKEYGAVVAVDENKINAVAKDNSRYYAVAFTLSDGKVYSWPSDHMTEQREYNSHQELREDFLEKIGWKDDADAGS